MAGWSAGALVAGMVLLLGMPYEAFSAGYVRPPARSLVNVSQLHGSSEPEQVHISKVGSDHMRVSWITDDKHAPSVVEYGKIAGKYSHSATGEHTSYSYFFYSSGKIHHVKIGPLDPNTTYYYRCGGTGSELSFKTPPSTFPITFAIVGDLGLTEWTASTLEHIKTSDYDALLLPGDLSYSDFHQPLWDTFGRFVEPLASSRPWMVTEGNHEIEAIPILFNHPFLSYNARWRMPYEESGSTSNLYYSFDMAGIHIIMLGSYTDFDSSSAQYRWLEADLAKVDREKTPWLIVCLHAPWYNTNTAHQGEGESMRKAMEAMLYHAHVDMVFAGHVHSYERFTRIYDSNADPCGPIYVTIGDGGNREGLALRYCGLSLYPSLFLDLLPLVFFFTAFPHHLWPVCGHLRSAGFHHCASKCAINLDLRTICLKYCHMHQALWKGFSSFRVYFVVHQTAIADSLPRSHMLQ